MISGSSQNPAVFFTVAAFLLLGSAQGRAQTTGYVTAVYGIEAFSAANGSIVNNFYPQGSSGTVAISSDGLTIYSPAITGDAFNLLNALSASTGETLFQVPGLYGTPKKTILDVTGEYAFVLCNGTKGVNSVTIVNLTKQAVVGYIYVVEGAPSDIAISPNGSKLFVSMQPTSGIPGRDSTPPGFDPQTHGPIYTCKAADNASSLCIFDTQPFGLASTVAGVSGDLALSQGGTWLYSWLSGADTYLTVVDTASFAVSRIKMPKGAYVYGFATAPSGNQAAVLVETGTSPSFLLLDTKTNTITGTFPGLPLQLPNSGSNVLAFSPDAKSLWSLGECPAQNACALLEGQAFPSGQLISQTPLAPGDYDGQAITF